LLGDINAPAASRLAKPALMALDDNVSELCGGDSQSVLVRGHFSAYSE
jgi:hypothetical protein